MTSFDRRRSAQTVTNHRKHGPVGEILRLAVFLCPQGSAHPERCSPFPDFLDEYFVQESLNIFLEKGVISLFSALYNGSTKQPDEQILLLSDSFPKGTNAETAVLLGREERYMEETAA